MVPETPSQIPLNELLALARELQEFLVAHGWHFCFIGGLAVQAWSEPRYTKDILPISTRSPKRKRRRKFWINFQH